MAHDAQAVYVHDDECYKADDCKALHEASRLGNVQLTALVRGSYPGTALTGQALSGVRSLGYWNAPTHQSWGLDWHRNEGLEITYLSSGELNFATDRFEGQLHSGQLTITRPWQPHRVGKPHVQASHLYWLIVDLEVRRPNQEWRWPDWINLTRPDLQRLTRILRQNETPVWTANRTIHDCWHRIARSLTLDENAHRGSRLQVQIGELFVELLALLESCNPELDTFLSSAERSVSLFLERLQRDIEFIRNCRTVDQMARMCNLSETRFSQICHALVNQSPGRYLNVVRVRHAQRLLRDEPSRSVTDIALECGFSTSQYFATVFRQVAGLNPRHWRSEQRGHRDV